MSCYENIYNDFPLRCARLWTGLRDSPLAKELDVTFMLMAAAAGFATPWEQLKIQAGQGPQHSGQHPAFNSYDEKAYKSSLKIVNAELDRPLLQSSLFRNGNFGEWIFGEVGRIGEILGAVEMRTLPKVDKSAIKARDIVKILRNAVAHNNIHAFTRKRRGAVQDQRISELTFFGEAKEKGTNGVVGYNVVSLPVEDFSNFLESWFALLKRSQPQGRQLRLVVADALAEDHDRIAA